MPINGTPAGSPSERRASSRSAGPKRPGSMPVGIELTREGATPMSRISCVRIASPVVTISAVALVYSHRVSASRGTGAEMCRVRTSGKGRDSERPASAASQASVELCALIASTLARREKATQRDDAARPLATDRQRGRRHAEARRLGEDSRLARAGDLDLMAASDHSGGFGQDTDLLATPAERGLGMNDAHSAALNQRPGPPPKTGSGAAWRKGRRARAARHACPARRRCRSRARRCGRLARSSTDDAR